MDGSRLLSSAVHEHFADPTVRAHYLIAMYQAELMQSWEVPGYAAEIFTRLPRSGPAWTGLAMAAPTDARSDLEPLLDEAAREIGYARDETQVADDIVTMQAYLAVTDGDLWAHYRVVEWLIPRNGPDALRQLADVPMMCAGEYGEYWSQSIRQELADYLNSRFSSR